MIWRDAVFLGGLLRSLYKKVRRMIRVQDPGDMGSRKRTYRVFVKRAGEIHGQHQPAGSRKTSFHG